MISSLVYIDKNVNYYIKCVCLVYSNWGNNTQTKQHTEYNYHRHYTILSQGRHLSNGFALSNNLKRESSLKSLEDVSHSAVCLCNSFILNCHI